MNFDNKFWVNNYDNSYDDSKINTFKHYYSYDCYTMIQIENGIRMVLFIDTKLCFFFIVIELDYM